jgi:hypothetical protein
MEDNNTKPGIKPTQAPIEEVVKPTETAESKPVDTITLLLAKIEDLERRDSEKEQKLKMLYEVADKGRVFNYENSNKEKKATKAKLAFYGGGYLIGWRTIKDELLKHPTTGIIAGEVQEYELTILLENEETKPIRISGYPAFSDARYTERVDIELIAKSEDYNGNVVFDVKLPDGRVIKLDQRFIN